MKKVSSINILKLFSILLAILLLAITGCGKSYTDPPAEDPVPTLEAGDTASFTLLQTTDVHHRASGTGASATYSPLDGLNTDDTEGGYARLAAQIANVRMYNAQQQQPTVLVDSGDFFMGTVYDMTLGDTPAALAFIELMKYDAITLGNHEFDYGPGALYSFISNARGSDGSGFTVPIIASNMVTDGAPDTDDDGIEALVAAGVISSVYTKTLPNGIKLGFIGLLGAGAESDAPFAAPVQFKNKLSGYDAATDNIADANVVADLQAVVDALKADVDVVIALSHSGVSDVATPAGDDIDLANAITGIDIIASGHEHKQTGTRLSVVNGSHTTYIFCAGYYGTNLAQLEVQYTKGQGVTATTLVNHPIDDSVTGNAATQFLVGMFDAGINQGLEALGFGINTILGGAGSVNLAKPHAAEETGMGNLVADSVRYMTMPAVMAGIEANSPMPPTVGIVANGVVRNGFTLGQAISFADLYSVLPLGMTPDSDQQYAPGYPLAMIWLTGAEIRVICQLNAYIIAGINPLLKPDFYLNLSGVQFAYDGTFQVDPASVKMYANTDIPCVGSLPLANIVDDTKYPCVVDIYVINMMFELNALIAEVPGLTAITPEGLTGGGYVDISEGNYMDFVIKNDGLEVKEWQALLTYLTSPADPDLGLGSMISDDDYGIGSMTRVNP